jgi:hypothetical protein
MPSHEHCDRGTRLHTITAAMYSTKTNTISPPPAGLASSWKPPRALAVSSTCGCVAGGYSMKGTAPAMHGDEA